MTKKNAVKREARARQAAHGGKYQHHHRSVTNQVSNLYGEETDAKDKEYPLGFFMYDPPIGQWVDITSSPVLPFEGRRLVVPSGSVAHHFEIAAILVDGTVVSMFAPPVSTTRFSEMSTDGRIKSVVVKSGAKIALRVRNVSGQKRPHFAAVIIGRIPPDPAPNVSSS